MKPIETLRLLYASGAHGHSNTLEADIEAHRKSGWALIEDDFAILFRICDLGWPLEQLRDPSQSLEDGRLCWVWAMAGDMNKAFRAAVDVGPAEQVEWLGWDRHGKPRLIPFSKILTFRNTGQSVADCSTKSHDENVQFPREFRVIGPPETIFG